MATFLRACFLGYATACHSAIRRAPTLNRLRLVGASETRLRLVDSPPADPRIVRIGSALPRECAFLTHAGRLAETVSAQLVCGSFRVDAVSRPYGREPVVRVSGSGAQLYGRSGMGSSTELHPALGLVYVLPLAPPEEGAALDPPALADGELPREGVLVAFEATDVRRTVWMDLATRRTPSN